MSAVAALGGLADLAEAQQGLVTTRQAERRGVPRRDLTRLARAGALERIAHGVYRISGAPRPRLVELRAAWMQLAPGTDVDRRTAEEGVVSHASATLVHRVGLLDPFRHEFSVPLPRRVRSRRPDVVIHRVPLAAQDLVWVDEILVTTPVRTVADLAASAVDGDHLREIVTDVIDRAMATRDELALALAPHAVRYGGSESEAHEFLTYLLDL